MRATGPTSRTAAVIVIVGVLLTLPCLTVGLPGDQDGPYHVDYQRSFSSQFWSGDLYPRWLVGLNAGMGTPIFYLQYPVPYFTGALLSPLLPDRPGQPKAAVELGVAAAIALIGSGLTFWIWLRRRMAAQPAALSAIVYMILPYHFTVDLYTRAAIGEHFAFVWLPLSMLFTENIVAGKRSGIPGFAISFALLLMSHLFTALLFFPVVAVWCYLQSKERERGRNLLRFTSAAALSTALAAVYLVPLASQRPNFDHRMLELDGSNNYYFHSHFAFVTESFLGYARSLAGRIGVDVLALSSIPAALAGLAVTAVVAARAPLRRAVLTGLLAFPLVLAITGPWSASLWRKAGLIGGVDFDQSVFVGKMFFTTISTALIVVVSAVLAKPGRHGRLVLLCTCTAAGALFMAAPYSRPIWESVPQLAMLEFPWRFNTLLTFSAAVLAASAFDVLLRAGDGFRKAAAVVLAILIAAVSFGNAALHNVQSRFSNPHRFSQEAGIEVLLRTYARSKPVDWIRKNELLVNTRPFLEMASDEGKAAYRRVGPREIQLDIRTPDPTEVKLKQLFYPGWRAVTDSGHELLVTSSTPEGALMFSVPPGRHRINVIFPATHAEIAGALISVSTVVILATMLFMRRRSRERSFRMQVRSSA